MAVYQSADQLYNVMQQLVTAIETQYPQATEAMLKSKLVIRFICRQPDGEMVVDARKRPLQIHYGTSLVKPQLDIHLDADTLHQILLGELNLIKALGSKKVEPKGPIFKAISLAPLFEQAQSVYPEILAASH
ncbi:MAG: SCP2 sterol-binding domain-containing protein [Chloroflexota bacterium]